MFHCYDLANRGDPDEISQNLHFYGWIFRYFARGLFSRNFAAEKLQI